MTKDNPSKRLYDQWRNSFDRYDLDEYIHVLASNSSRLHFLQMYSNCRAMECRWKVKVGSRNFPFLRQLCRVTKRQEKVLEVNLRINMILSLRVAFLRYFITNCLNVFVKCKESVKKLSSHLIEKFKFKFIETKA